MLTDQMPANVRGVTGGEQIMLTKIHATAKAVQFTPLLESPQINLPSQVYRLPTY
jgi:hypothetical protein